LEAYLNIVGIHFDVCEKAFHEARVFYYLQHKQQLTA